MELTINNQQSKTNLTYELTRRKLGMRIWGDRIYVIGTNISIDVKYTENGGNVKIYLRI